MKEINVVVIHDASIFHEDFLIGINTHLNYEPGKYFAIHMVIKNQILKFIDQYEKNPATYALAMKMKSNLADILYCQKEGIISCEEIDADLNESDSVYDKLIVDTGLELLKKGEVDIAFIATRYGPMKYDVNTVAFENDINITSVSSQLEFHHKFNRFLSNIKDDYLKHHKMRVRINNEINIREDIFRYYE